MSLTEVLPTEPVTPRTRAPSARRQARASDCIAASGSATAKTQAPPRPPRRARGRTTTPPGPGRDRRRGELAAVAAGAAQAEEEVAGAAGRGIDRRPQRRARRRPRRRPRPPARRRSPPRSASRRAAQLAQLLAGDLAIVEGDLAAVLELLALLVPLAGDDDGVARPGPAQRQGDRRPPVDLDLELGGPARRRPRLRRRSPPGPRSAGCRR